MTRDLEENGRPMKISNYGCKDNIQKKKPNFGRDRKSLMKKNSKLKLSAGSHCSGHSKV